ncbi:MAG: hypothetical protein AAF423_09180 [Pseudomonadota bacterium]
MLETIKITEIVIGRYIEIEFFREEELLSKTPVSEFAQMYSTKIKMIVKNSTKNLGNLRSEKLMPPVTARLIVVL